MSVKPMLEGPILPGATLGVLGGGQLGRMFVHAAQSMGYFTAVLDADADSPAGRVSHHQVRTAYDDAAGLAELAGLCAAVTTEFENVPAPRWPRWPGSCRCRRRPMPSASPRTGRPKKPISSPVVCPARRMR